MSLRVRTLLEPWFALNDRFPVGPRQAQKIVKAIANRAKISREVTPHVLRHTFATLALQKGISLAAVKKILGHDRLSTTEIYLNLTDIHVQEEYERKW
ncbi:MAG: tyrosine-type recombinase/integrase [Gammaproteobacteria bacterium]